MFKSQRKNSLVEFINVQNFNHSLAGRRAEIDFHGFNVLQLRVAAYLEYTTTKQLMLIISY